MKRVWSIPVIISGIPEPILKMCRKSTAMSYQTCDKNSKQQQKCEKHLELHQVQQTKLRLGLHKVNHLTQNGEIHKFETLNFNSQSTLRFHSPVFIQHCVPSAISVSKCESQSEYPSLSQSAFSAGSSIPLIYLTAITKLCGICVDRLSDSLPKLGMVSPKHIESQSNYENNIFIHLVVSDLKEASAI